MINDYSLLGIDYTLIENKLYFFIEVNGNHVFPIAGVQDLERTVFQETGNKIQLHVMSNIMTVASAKDYEPYRIFSQRVFEKLGPKFKKDIADVLERSNL